MKGISIVVPVWNEEKNVQLLTEQIYSALEGKDMPYEILFVDDRSTDSTAAVIEELAKQYPVQLFSKQGKQGKSFSLIEGFSYAKYDFLCMIDADLQYSPNYIPEMIAMLENGADIVVTNRKEYCASFIRKLASKVYHVAFNRMLHGFSCDVQSGLKAFKKDVIRHITLSPSPWTFDLEFLLKARHAKYRIDSMEIEFNKRYAGKSTINIVKSSLELGLSAFRLKFFESGIVPFSIAHEKKKGKGFHHQGLEYVNHTSLPMQDIAFLRLTVSQFLVLALFAAVLIGGLFYNWHLTLVIFITVLSFLYFADLLFNFFLVYRSYFREPEIEVKKRDFLKIPENEWPTYTILCPLYREWEVLPQFISAMASLDYPKEKLQVMLLLESEDSETRKKVKEMYIPDYFTVVIVPNSQPKTKPKALNYGLAKATGEYIVIYDAEDIPDPLQLKKAVLAFKKAHKHIICIQAKLNFYNSTQNILTRLFTLEYSLWFDLVLTGLQTIHAPIPLGGTSNHFRKQDLLTLKKWDPFNVTEDADLGMRLVKRGYNTALINSYTMEEANSEVINWYKQRSRWIKGYIQTYFVHMRRPHEFLRHWKSPHFLTFQLIIGAKVLSMLINPLMWAMTIAYFGFRGFTGEFIQSLYLTPIFYMAAFTMIVGNFLYMYYYMLGASKRNQWELIPFAILTPLYWLGMSAAAVLACWEFIFKPHYWHKTKHGLHLAKKEEVTLGESFFGVKQRPSVAVATS
jgi:glycosyltransferase XagB